MIAYEFYLRDPVKGNELVGILPERRKNTERITQKSVLHWAETVLGNSLNNKDVYYIEVTINEDTGKIFPATPTFITQKQVKKINPYSQSTEIRMRSFLINKNLSLYYWLKKTIGKRGAFLVANTIEKVILAFGRERVGEHGGL